MTQFLHSCWWRWFFSFPKRSEQLWGAPSLLFNVYQGLLAVKLLKHKHDHSTYSAEIRYEWIHTSTPPHAFMASKEKSLPSLNNITISPAAKSFQRNYIRMCIDICEILHTHRLIYDLQLNCKHKKSDCRSVSNRSFHILYNGTEYLICSIC